MKTILTTKKKTPSISQRAYALHRGCARSTLQWAIKSGRLKNSLEIPAKGSARIISAEAADAEWNANTAQSPEGRKDDAEAQRSLSVDKIDYNEARRRKEIQSLKQSTLATEQSERDAAVEIDDLVSKKAVTAMLVTEYTHIRTKVLGLPTRIRQRIPHVTMADGKVIASLCRELLEGLADGE